MKGVLFLCHGNSCRSQMAEGLARASLPEDVAVFSAGSEPRTVDPRAIESMKEIDIDISHHHSKTLDEIDADKVDCVITLCAEGEEACPVFPRDVRRLHWPLPDPAAARGSRDDVMGTFRAVRDDLADRLRELARGARTRA